MTRLGLRALRNQHLIKASRTLILRIGGRCLTLAATIALTRILGAAGYGVYAYAIAWTTLFTLTSSLGIDRLILRSVASYEAHHQLALLKGIILGAMLAIVALSSVTIFMFACVIHLAATNTYEATLLLALPLLLIQGLVQVFAASIQGLHHPEWSLVPYYMLEPFILTALLVGATIATPNIGSETAVGLTVMAAICSCLAAAFLLYLFANPLIRNIRSAFQWHNWIRTLIPLLAVALVTNASAQIGVITLGLLGTPADAGSFQVAVKGASLVSLVLVAINTGLAPRIARYHALNHLQAIHTAAREASRACFYYSLPVAVVILIFRNQLLSIFGTEFALTAGPSLVIIIVAEIFNAATGSVAVLLLMTGRGGDVAKAMLVGLGLNGILCVVLIPALGTQGAAVGWAAGLITWNVLLAIVVWRRLGINATAFARTSTH